jgi:hypothetical protein
VSKLGRWLPLAAVVALIGAAMVATVYANPTLDSLPESTSPRTPDNPDATWTPPTAQPTVTTLTPPEADVQIPTWITWLLMGLCAAAVLAVVISLAWMMFRGRLVDRKLVVKPIVEGAADRQELQAKVRGAVDDGLADLADDDVDPRRAVIACWVRLEEVTAQAGTARERGDTSTDLVIRLLGAHQVSTEVLAGLAEAYRKARFATHSVDVTMRDQARAALRQLRDELASPVVAHPGGEVIR